MRIGARLRNGRHGITRLRLPSGRFFAMAQNDNNVTLSPPGRTKGLSARESGFFICLRRAVRMRASVFMCRGG